MSQTPPQTRQDLFRSSIHVLVLSALAHGPMHGYAIQQQLKTTLGQTLPASSLYPLLHQLQSNQHIDHINTTHLGRARKVYHLTPSGQQHLRKAATDWQATIAQLQSLILPAVRRVAGKNK